VSGPRDGRDVPCANCGHRYGRHTLFECQQMIPIHGGEKSCDCPGWARAPRYVRPGDLLPAVQRLADEYPDVKLVKNEVGSLAVLDRDGTYIGYLDLFDGTLTLFAED
jgi:hypothetical protein